MCTVGSKIPLSSVWMVCLNVEQLFWWHLKTGKWMTPKMASVVSTYRPSFQIPLKKLDYLVLYSDGQCIWTLDLKKDSTVFRWSEHMNTWLEKGQYSIHMFQHSDPHSNMKGTCIYLTSSFIVSYFNSGDMNSGQVWCSSGRHQLSCQMF